MKVIYLIQSDKDECDYAIPPGSDVLVLNWKKNPCSYAEGRNRLYEQASRQGDYDYYVYMDDDVDMVNFDLADFNAALEKYAPPAAGPFCHRHHFYVGVKDELVKLRYADHMMLAVRKDVAAMLPYTTVYDKICWWEGTKEWGDRYEKFFGITVHCFAWFKVNNEQHRSYPVKFREQLNQVIK